MFFLCLMTVIGSCFTGRPTGYTHYLFCWDSVSPLVHLHLCPNWLTAMMFFLSFSPLINHAPNQGSRFVEPTWAPYLLPSPCLMISRAAVGHLLSLKDLYVFKVFLASVSLWVNMALRMRSKDLQQPKLTLSLFLDRTWTTAQMYFDS